MSHCQRVKKGLPLHVPLAGGPAFGTMCHKLCALACGTGRCTYFLDNVAPSVYTNGRMSLWKIPLLGYRQIATELLVLQRKWPRERLSYNPSIAPRIFFATLFAIRVSALLFSDHLC
jgi:hypothetical protein